MVRFRRVVFQAVLPFFAAALLLGAHPPGQNSGQPQVASAEIPWSLYVTGAKGDFFLPPVCHQLSYFSSGPPRFDYQQDFFDWPAGSFTSSAQVNRLGTVEKHQIYQVMQRTHHDPGKPPSFAWGEIVMRRILVDRGANEYCMILQETNSYGTLDRIDPATLTSIDGAPILFIHDRVSGEGGQYNDVAWTFDRGVPVYLGFGSLAEQVLKELTPPGCDKYTRGDPLSLYELTFRLRLRGDPGNRYRTDGGCGTVSIVFAIRNHTLVVVKKVYTPPHN